MGRPALTIEQIRSVVLAANSAVILRSIEPAQPMSLSRVVRYCPRCKNEWGTEYRIIARTGSGCPRCANARNARDRSSSKMREGVETVVYRIDSAYGCYCKVGVTQNLLKRANDVECRVPFALGKKVSVLFRGDKHTAIAFEKVLVERVETAGFHGFEGATEWLVSESLDKILLDA